MPNEEKMRRSRQGLEWSDVRKKRDKKRSQKARREAQRAVRDHRAELTDPRRAKLRHADYR